MDLKTHFSVAVLDEEQLQYAVTSGILYLDQAVKTIYTTTTRVTEIPKLVAWRSRCNPRTIEHTDNLKMHEDQQEQSLACVRYLLMVAKTGRHPQSTTHSIHPRFPTDKMPASDVKCMMTGKPYSKP